MKLTKRLTRYVPRSVLPYLRKGKRSVRRLRYETRQRLQPVTVDRDAVVAALRETGLDSGDAVFFQSAMSSFGEILGGATTVVDALEEIVGEEGLLAMPAFPIVGGAVEYLSAKPVFDVRLTPSTMGAISERFRKLPRTVRSLHPTHSVSVRGPGAERLVAGHESAATPFGVGTPFAGLIERNAWQIWFGCGIAAFTTYHAFECLRPDFPLPVFVEQPFSARCLDAEGREHIVETLVHDPLVSARRIDANPIIAARWRSLLLDQGVIRSVRLGRGEILSVQMRPLMAELERLLGKGITIYDLPVPATDSR